MSTLIVCILCPFHPGLCCGGRSSAFFNITAFNDFRRFAACVNCFERWVLCCLIKQGSAIIKFWKKFQIRAHKSDIAEPLDTLNMQTVERSGATLSSFSMPIICSLIRDGLQLFAFPAFAWWWCSFLCSSSLVLRFCRLLCRCFGPPSP